MAVAFAVVMVVPAQEAAPQFESLRDYETLAAMIAGGRDSFELIDVRTPAEFVSGHIPTAENIEYQNIVPAMDSMDRLRPVVVYCRTGNRSAHAARALRNAGFATVVDFGGINRWRGALVQ